MATLDNSDYTWIKNWVKRQPTVYRSLTSWGLSKAIYHNAIQAVENYVVNAFSNVPTTSFRAVVESVTGTTTTLRVQTIIAIWAAWKTNDWLGG